MSHLLETDGRRRVSLARLGVEKDSYFLAERRDDGSILLTPAEVRPKVLEVVERVVPDADAVAALGADDVRRSDEWEAAKAEVLKDDDARNSDVQD